MNNVDFRVLLITSSIVGVVDTISINLGFSVTLKSLQNCISQDGFITGTIGVAQQTIGNRFHEYWCGIFF